MLTDTRGRMRDAAFEDVTEVGAAVVPILAAVLSDADRSPQKFGAAVDLLVALDLPTAAQALTDALASAPEAWQRRYCAYGVGLTTQDKAVPRLLLRLKYERDHETVVWVAVALAHFRNYAGVSVLIELRSTGESQAVQALASSELAKVVADTEHPDGETLRDQWRSERAADLPQSEPSSGLRLAFWTLIAELSEEHFQLRGVDDARFVLSRLGPWAVAPLAEALAERDFHVRLCVAQVLERTGRRAAAAVPALVRALDDARFAPAAAEALGSVGDASLAGVLLERMEPGVDHELRVACLRALGRIAPETATARVRALFDDTEEPGDLRLAAATALVQLGEGARAAEWLALELTNELGDPAGAELTLDTWLRRVGGPALEVWDARAETPGLIPTAEEAAERRRLRGQELRSRLPQITGTDP